MNNIRHKFKFWPSQYGIWYSTVVPLILIPVEDRTLLTISIPVWDVIRAYVGENK